MHFLVQGGASVRVGGGGGVNFESTNLFWPIILIGKIYLVNIKRSRRISWENILSDCSKNPYIKAFNLRASLLLVLI